MSKQFEIRISARVMSDSLMSAHVSQEYIITQGLYGNMTQTDITDVFGKRLGDCAALAINDIRLAGNAPTPEGTGESDDE